jgi:hypothetical protein
LIVNLTNIKRGVGRAFHGDMIGTQKVGGVSHFDKPEVKTPPVSCSCTLDTFWKRVR